MADTTKISRREWLRYIERLRKLNDKAADSVKEYVNKNGGTANVDRQSLIDYAYGVATKYGEGAATLSAEMYDAVAMLEGKNIKNAVPADTPSYSDVAKTVNGILKQSDNEEMLSSGVGRLVKRTGVDTVVNNALRDGAEWAWIPVGDTCAFCIMLASQGWVRASRKAIKNGHAEHIHANCDCTYAVRFDSNLEVEGYNPDEYRKIYYGAEGRTGNEKLNSIRRMLYAQNKNIVGDESDKAEELIRSISDYEKSIMNNPTESAKLYKKDGSVVDFGGVEHSVIGDASVLNEMEGGILTHNHPTDVTFSNNDIANGIVKGNLAELRAITINGNLHQLINENASIDDRRKFFVQFNERIKKFTNIAHDKIRRGERINQQEYINSRLEQWLLENAPQYHLRYIKTSVN